MKKTKNSYYIIDYIGRTLGEYETLQSAKDHLILYTGKEIEENKLEIIDNYGNEF